MEAPLETIWIASHPVMEQAQFIRQKLFPILLSSKTRGLINMIGASLWISETEGTDSEPQQGQRLPDHYTDVDLYHIRMDRLIHKDDILGHQGIRDGDVLVLMRGSPEQLNRMAARIRDTAEIPAWIPADRVPDHIISLSASDLLERLREVSSPDAAG